MATAEKGFFDLSQSMNSDGNYTSAEVPYFVFDAEDEEEAIESVYDSADSTLNGMALDTVEVSERINDGTFKLIANYERSDADSLSDALDQDGDGELDPVFSFDTTGATSHRQQSISTISKYPSDGAPDFGGAVNVEGDEVKGVDIVMPVYNFSETHYFDDDKVTTAYKTRLATVTGAMNYDSFKGFAQGEVLFLGASGSRRGTKNYDLWEITFKFACSPTETDFKVGDITVTKKFGWDYMWVLYAKSVDTGKKSLLKKPVAVYIERIYKVANFSTIGIGN